MIDEQRYRALIQQLATGGITGNNNNYMNGGGVGSMMQPKRGLVNGPGGYAGSIENIINSAYPQGNFLDIKETSPTQKDYNINATKDLVENLPGGILRDILAPAAAATLSVPYDTIQGIGRAVDNSDVDTSPYGGIVDDMETPRGPSLSDLSQAINAENPLSSLVERTIGASAPLAERLSGMNFGMSQAAASEIDVNDLTNRNNRNFLISAADALPNQTGMIESAPSITNNGVRTMEGSLIDGDDITSRYGVQQDFKSDRPFDRDFSNFDDARMGNANQIPDRNRGQIPSGIMSSYVQPSADYPDMIRNPENFPNRLQNLERYQDNRFEDLEFQEGFNFIDAPNKVSNLKELYQNRNFMDNPRTGFFDNTIMSKGNSDASLINKAKNGIGGLRDFLPFGDKSLTGMAVKGLKNFGNKFNNPNAPKYMNYDPTGKIDYSKLNTNNLNDFYDDNPESETYGTTRFDRAKPGSFGSFRTLADYFNRNKNIKNTGITAAANNKKAADAIKAAERQTELNRRQSIANAQAARGQTTSGGAGNYRSDRDNSRAGGYGGSGRASRENRSSDLGFSDIRLKDNIELVGKSPSDINIYNFTYLNDPKVYQGVMAQEVPWASVKHDSGYLMVDYNKVDVDFKVIH